MCWVKAKRGLLEASPELLEFSRRRVVGGDRIQTPSQGTTLAGDADFMKSCLGKDMVGAGGSPGPDTNQLRDLGQVTALPKPQFLHEMNPLTPDLASPGDHWERGQENL